MKGSAVAYGGIFLILIITSFVFIYMTGASPIDRAIVTQEGKIISFVNYAELLIKTFNQSIYFISQRAAYDLGKNGGLNSETFWSYNYPKMDILENNLIDKIKNNLPISYEKGEKEVTWDEAVINVLDYDKFPCGSIENSVCFFVEGDRHLDVYDKNIDSRISVNNEINSDIDSNYFKLLNAGRTVMEDEQFNQYLNDTGALLNELYVAKATGDPRFDDLDFSASIDGDIVEITIVEYCYPPNTYCLAPLNSGETGSLDPIPYDYIELKFKYQKEQTGFTPLDFNFDLEVLPDSGSVESGGSTETFIKVRKLGGESKIVHLSYSINPPQSTISVSFTPASDEPTYNSLMKIETSTTTMAGIYTITITGTGNGLTRETTYTLTVNPSMLFDINVVPVADTIEIGDSTNPTVNLNFISGTPSLVSLSASDIPPDTTVTFAPVSCNPTCSSTMTVITQATTPPGVYPITITGIGGGIKKQTIYTLTVKKPFDFRIDMIPATDTVASGESTITSLDIVLTEGISKEVTLSYSALDILGFPEPTISASFSTDSGFPTFNSIMIITTQITTPSDTYLVIVTGKDGGLTKTKTFILNVITPACYDDADCNDGNACTGAEASGGIDVCINPGTADAYCYSLNLPNGYVPSGDVCGTITKTCEDKCESNYEYRGGSTETCSIACDGGGSCLSDCNPPACIYSEERECKFGCKDGVNCWGGIWCEGATAKCRVGILSCDNTCFGGNECFSEDGGPKPVPDILCQVTCTILWVQGWSKVITDCSACTGGCSGALSGRECACGGSNSCGSGGIIKSGCWMVDCYPTDTCTYS